MTKNTGYHVALRYTAAAGPDYVGLVTKHEFEDKEEFDGWLRRALAREKGPEYEVVAHGITEDEVIKLCQKSEKELAAQTAAVAKDSKRAVKKVDVLLDRFKKDPKILAIFSQPHPGTRH